VSTVEGQDGLTCSPLDVPLAMTPAAVAALSPSLVDDMSDTAVLSPNKSVHYICRDLSMKVTLNAEAAVNIPHVSFPRKRVPRFCSVIRAKLFPMRQSASITGQIRETD